MTEQPSDQTGTGVEVVEDEISILDLLVVLARQKRTIVRTVMWFGIVGLLVAVFSPSEYTSSATVIREVEDGAGAGSSALDALRGFGIGVGGASFGLTADAYPDVLKSREVRVAVARDTFRLSGRGEEMTFVEYVDHYPGFFSTIQEYTIGLPGKILSSLSVPPDQNFESPGSKTETVEDENAIGHLSDMLTISKDRESGLMTISVSSRNPMLSLHLAYSFVDQMVERVRSVYTEKSRQNLDFIQERFEEAELKLAAADSALAQFEDRNVGVISARLDTERQRLQRQVTFKSQLYSDLQTQLTQTEIELQRAEPVITVLERPVPARGPSGPRRKLIFFFFLILGGIVGFAVAFVRTGIENSKADESTRRKLDEVFSALPTWRLRQKV